MTFETAFNMDTSSIKYGVGVTAELGWDMRRLGGTRVMVVTDPRMADSRPVEVDASPKQVWTRPVRGLICAWSASV